MRKKLWALNLLLVIAAAILARELRNNWKTARDREQKILGKELKNAPVPPVPRPAAPAPVQAAAYLDVAQQNLFSKDRNPNIVVEAEKPKPPPPFPRFYGVMNLGEGPLAILSSAGRQQPFKVGDKVGDLLLTAIGEDSLVFEWEKQKLTKKFGELQDRSQEQSTDTTRTAVAPAAAAPVVQRPVVPEKPGPGADIGGGMAACGANDPTPVGTVMDGKRKVVTETMFGKICRWEPAR
jgi:hypothetical protein